MTQSATHYRMGSGTFWFHLILMELLHLPFASHEVKGSFFLWSKSGISHLVFCQEAYIGVLGLSHRAHTRL